MACKKMLGQKFIQNTDITRWRAVWCIAKVYSWMLWKHSPLHHYHWSNYHAIFSYSTRITNLLYTFFALPPFFPLSLFISHLIFLGWDSPPCPLVRPFYVSNCVSLLNPKHCSCTLIWQIECWLKIPKKHPNLKYYPTFPELINIARPNLSILWLPRELFSREAKCETCCARLTGKWAVGFARMDL